MASTETTQSEPQQGSGGTRAHRTKAICKAIVRGVLCALQAASQIVNVLEFLGVSDGVMCG